MQKADEIRRLRSALPETIHDSVCSLHSVWVSQVNEKQFVLPHRTSSLIDRQSESRLSARENSSSHFSQRLDSREERPEKHDSPIHMFYTGRSHNGVDERRFVSTHPRTFGLGGFEFSNNLSLILHLLDQLRSSFVSHDAATRFSNFSQTRFSSMRSTSAAS